MASTTSGSLPSSPSLPANATFDVAADQEFSSHHHNHHQGLFFPSSASSPGGSMYLESSFHGVLPASSSTPMSPSHSHQAPAQAPLPPPPAPSKPPKKRPRASRRPPTTVLTTDTSNFHAMVQEFTGFPAPPFAAVAPPAVRPRLLGGVTSAAVVPPFLLRPSPLKYPLHNPALQLPLTCTATTLANTGGATTTSSNNITSTSSLVDALALFAKSNVLPSTAVSTAGGSSHGAGADHYGHGMMRLGGFNPFVDDFEAEGAPVPDGEKANASHVFFSSLGGAAAGDKYDNH